MKPGKRIVLLEERKSVHLESLLAELDEEPVIIDAGDLNAGLSIEYDTDSPDPTITYNDLRITPGEVKSVWYRSVVMRRLRPDLRFQPEVHEYALSAMQHLADSLVDVLYPGPLWLSPRHAITRAERKPLQIAMARKVGLRVPSTLFTGSGTKVTQFMTEQGPCAVKPLAKLPPVRMNQYTVFRRAGELDLRGLEYQPHIFQPGLRPAMEVRVAVVGRNTYACIVEDDDAQNVEAEGVRDYRHAFDTGSFRCLPLEVPSEIEASCIELVRQAGLICGFMDFLVDEDEVWWFLEINPNGQWRFMHPDTVREVARAIARILQGAVAPWPAVLV